MIKRCRLCGSAVWALRYSHRALVRHLDLEHPGWRNA